MQDAKPDPAQDADVADPLLIQLHQAVRRLAGDMRMPGGVFHDPRLTTFDIRLADGARVDHAITKSIWLQLYFELRTGAVDATALPTVQELEARGGVMHKRSLVPIALANFRYHSARDLFDAYAAAKLQRAPFQIPDAMQLRGLVRAETAFFACAFLADAYENFLPRPPCIHGLGAAFVLPRNLLVGNTGLQPSEVEVDFDEGLGFRSVAFDQPIPVAYPRAGTYSIKLRARYGATMLTTRFEFTVRDEISIPRHVEWDTITSQTSFNGVTATGHAWVFYGAGHGDQLVDPVIISEGFPGNYCLDYLWSLLEQRGFAQALLQAGKDLIVLGYDDGTTYIEANAGVAIACIKRAIAERAGNRKLAVGGASMGGLITRYALAKLEADNDPAAQEIATYLSIDSPHEGANLPLGLLAFVDFFQWDNPDVMKLKLLFDSIAAQEMLLYWYDAQTKSFKPSPLRHAFRESLAKVGNFPKLPRKFGLADGTGNGNGNGTPPGRETLTWKVAAGHAVACKLASSPGIAADAPDGASRRWIFRGQLFREQERLYYAPPDMADIDSAPGGTSDFFKAIYDKLNYTGQQKELYFADGCFIPTASAVAMGTLDLYRNGALFRNLEKEPAVSALGGIRWSRWTNLPHVVLSLNGATWLAELLDVLHMLVRWRRGGVYDSKAWIPAVALQPDGDKVVSVHEGPSQHGLHYRVGQVTESLDIIWDGASHQYDPGGNRPTIAISSRGDIVEVHKTSRGGDYTLYYYRGMLDAKNWRQVNFPAHSQQLIDRNRGNVYGIKTRVALRDDVVALVWENAGRLWYMLGQFAANPQLIDWWPPQLLMTPDDGPADKGSRPTIAITLDLQAVVSFSVAAGRYNELHYKIGRIPYVDSKLYGPIIDWETRQSRVYAYDGVQPSFAVDAQGRLLAVQLQDPYNDPPNGNLRFAIGTISDLPLGSVAIGGAIGWYWADTPVITTNETGLVVVGFETAQVFKGGQGHAYAAAGIIEVKRDGTPSAAAARPVEVEELVAPAT